MKQSTDFARSLTNFLGNYLPNERGVSHNTIKSYSYTFILLINYMRDVKKVTLQKLSFLHITRDTVVDFLDWLQDQRKCCNATRNQRLAAISSFIKFAGYKDPVGLQEAQQVLAIKIKKTGKQVISYLTIEGVELLLKQPDISKDKGLRDLALLSLMYESAARVQEIIDLTPAALSVEGKPYRIQLRGKGNKHRIVPLPEKEVQILLAYMERCGLTKRENEQKPLFHNAWGQKMTRNGINNILKKYTTLAKSHNTSLIPAGISCHSMRHSKAMALLDAKVQLIYIRDFLGHKSVTTTEIYARVNAKYALEAIKTAYKNVVTDDVPAWEGNDQILQMLKTFVR
jgi:integrase/recombinase XerD